MSLSKREKVLLIIVALLALIALYYMFYLKPCIDDINATNSEADTLKLELSALDQTNAHAVDLQAQIDSMDQELTLYGGEITHTLDQPALLVYLSETVGDYATKNGIIFAYDKQIGSVQHYTISIGMVTTYDQLNGLLAAIENSPYLLRVSYLNITLPNNIVIENDGTDTEGSSTDTTAETSTQSIIPADQSGLKLINVELHLDFYCLSNPIPEDEDYTFDSPHQYGGDIFY